MADGPAGAEEKPRPGGGVGVAGPVGPGVVDAMPTGVLMFRGSDPLRVPRLHAIRLQPMVFYSVMGFRTAIHFFSHNATFRAIPHSQIAQLGGRVVGGFTPFHVCSLAVGHACVQ